MPQGGWQAPDAGDAPEGLKKILAAAYSSCRDAWAKDHPKDIENQDNKTRCAQGAWTAVHNAGWSKGSDGQWTHSAKADMREELKAASDKPSDYLIVGDPQMPTTWHLQVKRNGTPDHGLMGAAWAALHEGFRGNKYEGPNKEEALSKLKKLYDSEGIPLPIAGKLEGMVIAIKAATGEMILQVLGAPFGSQFMKDSQGDFFDSQTNIHADRYPEIPLIYAHGFNPRTRKQMDVPVILGKAKYSHVDEHGHWYQAILDKTNAIAQKIWESALKGLVKASSGAINYLVRREKNGHLVEWPIGELTLVDVSEGLEPANPYAIAVPMLKADYELAGMKIDLDDSEATGDVASPTTTSTKTGDTTMTEEEKKAAEEKAKQEEATRQAALKANLEIDPSTMEGVVQSVLDEHKHQMELKAQKEKQANALRDKMHELLDVAMKTEPAKQDHGFTFKTLTVDQAKNETRAFMKYLRDGDYGPYLKTQALNETTDENGAALVPKDFYNQIVQKRDPMSIARAAGATVLQTSLKAVDIPIENTRLAKFDRSTEITVDENNVQPFDTLTATVYPYTKLVKVSKDLLNDQKANLEPFLAKAFGSAAASRENDIFLIGDGTSEAQGAVTGGTLGRTATDDATIDDADVNALYYSLPYQYRQGAVWCCTQATEAAIRSIVIDKNYAFDIIPQGAGGIGMPNLLKGARLYNVDSMDEIAASNQTLLWANWEYYFLVENGTMTIERLNELYAGTRQVGFLATFRVGGLVTQTEAFKYLIQKSA